MKELCKCHRVRKCAVRLGLESETPRLRGKCSTDWAIRLPDTLSPLWWLSLYHEIHPHKFEIHPLIFIARRLRITKQACTVLLWVPNVTGWEICAFRPVDLTRDCLLTGRVLYRLSYLAAWHIISPMVTKSVPCMHVFIFENILISSLSLPACD